ANAPADDPAAAADCPAAVAATPRAGARTAAPAPGAASAASSAVTTPAAARAAAGGGTRLGSHAVISVVIPVHDEERSIALLHEELEAALDPLGEPWEVVFVDDGSEDGSHAALTRLHARAPNVRVVRLRRNFGKSAALAAGFARA